MEDLQKEHARLLSLQSFDEADLDYSLLEYHKQMLSHLAKVSNSGITVFDMYKRKHVYTSFNFGGIFGDCKEGIDERVHPDDLHPLIKNGITALRFLHANKENLQDYKMISEFRICNAIGQYVRVVEQYTLLEKDKSGNAWLSLSVLDLSPDQSSFKTVRCHILNVKENKFFSIENLLSRKKSDLTTREIAVLQLIKEGLLSKEISEQLFISVHTVNTHRQRILEKLDVNNSMEAVKYASALGLIS
ncbi:response regulator transcription factor [Dysgonomonas termitidis]|uniref:Response regulator transcription factor n=1 Tax=Dysgonomonas termitidis TaxID=1516126 RepID=A0ABV9KZK5_9BACT